MKTLSKALALTLVLTTAGCSKSNDPLVMMAKQEIDGKLFHSHKALTPLFKDDSAERIKRNTYIKHVEEIRLSIANTNSGIQQNHKTIPTGIFGDRRVIEGFYFNSTTGQSFSTYQVYSEKDNLVSLRASLQPSVSKLGGWCRITVEDKLSCDFPMLAEPSNKESRS